MHVGEFNLKDFIKVSRSKFFFVPFAKSEYVSIKDVIDIYLLNQRFAYAFPH